VKRRVHVVALNWRDLKNPLGGGAEVHMEEILRHLGRRGHRCTLLTSHFAGVTTVEEADGYRIIRGGHELNFNFVVPFLYRRLARTDPADIILDDINKIPFYSPLWTRVPVLAVIPHLMGEYGLSGSAPCRRVGGLCGGATGPSHLSPVPLRGHLRLDA
jgi:hypothetical protein